ncbi:MAG: prepilin-type N-terminal cleavage/methylation domain-containing protein [Proteobacteria bacterium]|nr:hypothetical protein [Pseudomonadota bacterium]NOG58897.1 prepilin-type N-terminal cleavage/methylation domain-containing protein [Pseudomonadota bacterium]
MKVEIINKKRIIGFTLLELVLVLFILAILTTTSLSFIENEDGQIRYEASIKKRDAVIDALYRENLEANQRILSGYVVDNGLLPPIDAINDDSDERINYWLFENSFEIYSSVNAYSDTDGITPELLTDGTNNYPMFKGFRSGAYLRADNRSGSPSSNDEFNDEWGANLFISDIGEPNANDIIIGFDGDGGIDFDLDTTNDETQLVKPDPFNVDNDIIFSEADWTVDRDQLHIIFTTNDAACVGCDYTISISVFRNNTTCGATASDCWDTYYYTLAGLNDGDSRDTLVDAETWNHNGNGSATRVPVGEHLAVVLDTAGDATTLASARFKVLPNSTQPTVTLTVP